jgi:hypothetical protein
MVMLLCSYGFYIAWYASLQAIHNSQKAIMLHSDLHKNKLVKLVFSKNDFEKNTRFTFDDDDKEEFEYNKQMYDVAAKKIINDSIYVTCISDTQEENLRDVAMAQILSGDSSASGKELPIFKFRLDHYTNSFQTISSYFFIKKNTKRFIKHTRKPGSPYIYVSSPPPWIVIS